MAGTIRIAWYNLENLFEPGQHPELKSEWTAARYERKLDHLATVVAELHGGDGPDLLGICEIQSDTVVQELVDRLPNSGAYAIVHHDSPDVRLIDVGFTYRKAVLSQPSAEAFNIQKRYPTRDILDVTFKVTGTSRELHVVGNHWPSRSGGQYESEPYRIMVAENCAWVVDTHYDFDPDVNLLVVGDFNDDPYSRSVREYLYAIENLQRVASRRGGASARPYLYNLMGPLLNEPSPGTFYYGGTPSGWNMFDQVMVSKALLAGTSGLHVLEESITIHRPERIRDGAKPKPFRRKKTGWVEGFSDHFPVTALVELV